MTTQNTSQARQAGPLTVASNVTARREGWPAAAGGARYVSFGNFRAPVAAISSLGTRGLFATPGGGSFNAAIAPFDSKTITGVARPTSATTLEPVEVTIATHGYSTGDYVTIAGITGATEAEGPWIITKIDANTFSLDGSEDIVELEAYTSGGTARLTEIWLAPSNTSGAEQYYVLNGLRIAAADANALIALNTFLSMTALTNGLNLRLYDERTGVTTLNGAVAASTDARTVRRTLNPVPLKTDVDLALWGKPEIVINATGFQAAFDIKFDEPLVVDGEASQYLAFQLADIVTAVDFFQVAAYGYAIEKAA